MIVFDEIFQYIVIGDSMHLLGWCPHDNSRQSLTSARCKQMELNITWHKPNHTFSHMFVGFVLLVHALYGFCVCLRVPCVDWNGCDM